MSSIFSINQDTFIYSVNQAYNARNNLKTGFNSHLKFTPFLDSTWEKPLDANFESLQPIVLEIVKHHFKAISQYGRGAHVDLENISWFAHSIACLYADIAYLFKETLGHEFLEKNEENQKFWNFVDTTIDQVFKEYAILFHVFTNWKHRPQTEQTVKVDWNVRPPCGSLYRQEFKELFEEERNSRFGKKSFSKDKDFKNKDKDKDSDKSKSSFKQHDHKKRFDSKDSKESKHHRHNKGAPQASEAQLKAAKDECLKAIETMKKNKKIPEIPLSAQNSFIRREQHTLITEAGFETDSRGEGANRHVCIVRSSSN